MVLHDDVVPRVTPQAVRALLKDLLCTKVTTRVCRGEKWRLLGCFFDLGVPARVGERMVVVVSVCVHDEAERTSDSAYDPARYRVDA